EACARSLATGSPVLDWRLDIFGLAASGSRVGPRSGASRSSSPAIPTSVNNGSDERRSARPPCVGATRYRQQDILSVFLAERLRCALLGVRQSELQLHALSEGQARASACGRVTIKDVVRPYEAERPCGRMQTRVSDARERSRM